MHGVAVVTSRSTWMAGKEIFLKLGYEVAGQAPPHYELLVRRSDPKAPMPAFSGNWERKLDRYAKGLTIIYSDQCPYVAKAMDEIPPVAREEFELEPTVIALTGSRAPQASPNPYGVFSVIWNGNPVADHPISKTRFANIMNKLLEGGRK
jgi:hypothetical protein